MIFVGLDLGKRQDYSAVAVVERFENARAWLSPDFQKMQVRHLERLPLGTPYTRVVSRVAEIMRHPDLAQPGSGGSRLVVDATGVGAPVVEMLRALRPACRVTAVTITGGENAHGSGEEWHVPKKDLMVGLQVLLEDGQLKIHRKLAEAATLVRELMAIQMGSMSGGHGEHDDLALAVALACWRARRLEIGFGTRRLL